MTPEAHAKERRLILNEVKASEERYLAVLKHVAAFSEPLKMNHLLPDDVRRRMFPSALEAMRIVGQAFLKDLENNLALFKNMGDLFVRLATECSIIVPYALSFSEMTKLYTSMKNTSPQFRHYVEATFAALATRDKDMTSLLVAPVQRVARYLLFCKQLLKHANPGESDGLRQAEGLFAWLCQKIEDKSIENEHVKQLYEIQERLRGDFESIVAPTRRFMYECRLHAMHDHNSPEERILFLFNDLLVLASVARDGAETKHLFLRRVNLEDVGVSDGDDHGEYFVFHLILDHEATCVGFVSELKRDECKNKLMEQLTHVSSSRQMTLKRVEHAPSAPNSFLHPKSDGVVVIGEGANKSLRHRRSRSDYGALQAEGSTVASATAATLSVRVPPLSVPSNSSGETVATATAAPRRSKAAGKSGSSRKKKEIMVALRDSVPSDATNFLLVAFRKGDELVIVDKSNPSGWYWGHLRGTKVGGLIRADAVDSSKSTAVVDLLHSDLTNGYLVYDDTNGKFL